MTGREEMDNRKFDVIENSLFDYPDYVTKWYYHLRANGKTASSCKVMIGKVGKFLSFINPTDKSMVGLDQITPEIIEQYMINIRTKEKNGQKVKTSSSYQQTVLSCLNNFLSFLTKRNLIQENYIETQEIRPVKRKDEVDRPYLTGKDFRNIIKKISIDKKWDDIRNRDVAMIMLLMNTGIRVSALCAINLEDLDLENGKVTVMEKREKARECSLNEETIRVLKDWLEVRGYLISTPWINALFVTEQGFRVKDSTVREAVQKRCKEAGYKLTPHMLRGGYITILQEATGDINFVCQVVGHEDISTTRKYIRPSGKENEKAAEIMAKAISF